MNATCCPDHDQLEAYLLGNLDDAAVDAHLDACPDCQAALDTLDAAVNLPFQRLREPAGATADWEQPTFQHLVEHAKGISPATADLDDAEADRQRLPYPLGNYLLLELVAVSGMGRVYKAQHLHLKKTVAVKLVAPWIAPSAEGRQRFRQEMEAVGRLASPHIVTAFDAGEVDGVDFLAMEFIEGDDFQRLVQKQGPLPIAKALDCILQAARGLDVAHRAGIIHRDVKPSNLLLDASGTVKVLDLGLALFMHQEATTTGSAIMGTPAFMAPEQGIDTNKVDARTDVYALGCTLHFLLTGKPPFATDNGRELVAAHRDQPIPSLRALRPDCPTAVDALFRRMLAKDPQDRPASMKTVCAEIERLLHPAPARQPIAWRGIIAAGIVLAIGTLVSYAFWSVGDSSAKKKDVDAPGIAMPKKGATPAIDMVRIPSGEFMMGSSDADPNALASEKPRAPVKLNRAFFLGKTEITQAQYEEVIGSNPSAFSAKGSNKARVKDVDTSKHPVESVSWIDAVRFCNKLSERHEVPSYYKITKVKDDDVVTIRGGVGYRLPTEAEWEYACRAGTKTTWHFGEKADDLKDHAWYAENSSDRTHPVGQKKPNAWGLYDMYGNVPEWCWDRYDPDYYSPYLRPASDPVGSKSARERAIRGDSWNSRLPRTSAPKGLAPPTAAPARPTSSASASPATRNETLGLAATRSGARAGSLAGTSRLNSQQPLIILRRIEVAQDLVAGPRHLQRLRGATSNVGIQSLLGRQRPHRGNVRPAQPRRMPASARVRRYDDRLVGVFSNGHKSARTTSALTVGWSAGNRSQPSSSLG